MNLHELISVARGDAYRDRRHCHQRRKAFERDVAKAVKTFEWHAFSRKGFTIVTACATIGGLPVLASTGIDWKEAEERHDGMSGALASTFESLTEELLRNVARATKNRLDGHAGR